MSRRATVERATRWIDRTHEPDRVPVWVGDYRLPRAHEGVDRGLLADIAGTGEAGAGPVDRFRRRQLKSENSACMPFGPSLVPRRHKLLAVEVEVEPGDHGLSSEGAVVAVPRCEGGSNSTASCP